MNTKIPNQRLHKAEAHIVSGLLLFAYTVRMVWSIRKDIPTLLRNRYWLPLKGPQGRHSLQRGRHRPAPGRHGISPVFVAQFKGLTPTLQHHAA
jgi:hypothetical protein